MKIKCHLLRKNESDSIPSHLLFLDTESFIIAKEKGFVLPFRLGWTCYVICEDVNEEKEGEWKCWRSKKKMIDYIFSKCYEKTCLYVFAHNIFHDLRAIDFFRYAKKERWNIEMFIDSGKTSFLKVRKEKKSIAFLSTTNFFPYSLMLLGENIGINKGEVNFKTVKYCELKRYCKQDTLIIKKVMIDFFRYIKLNNLGRFCITAPAQAMYCYRYRFMTQKIFPPNDENIIELERQSYHGGRTECFFIGELLTDQVFVYDVNSMYPYVMKNNYFPTYSKYVYKKMKISKMRKIIKYFCVIAKVKISTNIPIYGVEYNNRLIFPVGVFCTVLTTPEIQYALKHNHIRKIYDVVLYTKGKIFSQYVDFFYKEKVQYKEGKNKPYETLSKLFLNSLYGKFGQRGQKQSVDINYESDVESREKIIDLETGKISWKTELINTNIIDQEDRNPVHTFVGIASHVTAYARIYLYELILRAGRKNVYYCDTDSIFVNLKCRGRLKKYIDETKLGKLKLEKKPHNLRIYGLKDYKIDGKAVLKGIRGDAKLLPDGRYKQKQFESLKVAISKKHLDKPHVNYVIKKLSREYKKGIVKSSGRVVPFRLGWLQELIDYLKK